ncbi:MAG: amidohydrolase family protein [Paenibacillaceae bacterium]
MFDFHTHFIPHEVLSWIKDHQQTINAKWIKKDKEKDDFLFINEKWGFELKPLFTNSVLYLEERARVGVTHSVISPIPQLFMYDFPVEITVDISNVYNRALAEWAKSTPESISALGTVPLNNPDRAVEVLNDAMSLGLKGAIIGPGLSNTMLSDDYFIPFFEEANRHHAIIFIHPLLSDDPRLKRRMMPNLIGVPWETTVCATDLLLSGFIDKYPKIKILLAHGGGFLPYQIGRMNKGYSEWREVSSALQAPPIEYLKHFWYDNVLWSDESLKFLINTVGEERVVPGSDFPFDLCVWPPEGNSEKGVHSLLGT